MHTETVSLGLVEDQHLLRTALVHFIKDYTPFEVILEAGNGKEFIEKIKNGKLPDILLLDLSMPVMNGFDTLEWLHQHHPQLPVIVFTHHATDLTLTKLIKLGARAFLKKKDACDKEMTKVISRVKEDGFYFNDPVARNVLLAMYKAEKKKHGVKVLLTDKEWRFLKLAASDLTYKQIADEMNISIRAVNKISNGLFEKIGVQNRTALALEAVRHGIVPTAA